MTTWTSSATNIWRRRRAGGQIKKKERKSSSMVLCSSVSPGRGRAIYSLVSLHRNERHLASVRWLILALGEDASEAPVALAASGLTTRNAAWRVCERPPMGDGG